MMTRGCRLLLGALGLGLALSAPRAAAPSEAGPAAPRPEPAFHRLDASSAADLFATKSWHVDPPPPPPPKPTAPALPFSYAGRMEREDATVVFLNRGERNYIVRAGDQVDAQYRIEAISADAVRIEYLPLHEIPNLSVRNNP